MMPDINDIELSGPQSEGMDRLVAFCQDPSQKFIALSGFSGTGKTTLVTRFVGEVGRGRSVALTATTNKAKGVLDKMAYEASAPVADVRTVYSLLGLKLDSKNEIREIVRGSRDRLEGIDIVVVDEASMVNAELYQYIHDSAAEVKFIFVGDPLQLPPVGEDSSPVFSEADHEVLELTEVVRQAEGNPIIALGAHLRECILSGGGIQPNIKTVMGDDGKSGVHVLEQAKFKAWMRAGFKSPKYESDPSLFRTIAWRNDTVRAYNHSIRKAIYEDQLMDPFMLGEKVISTSPVMLMDPMLGITDDMEIVMPVDSEGWIIEVEEMIHPYIPKQYGEFKVWRLEIGGGEEGAVDAYMLHPDSDRAFNQKVGELAAAAKKERRLWGAFWGLKNRLADIRPAHALTAHRSQGSTYENVFVDAGDIFVNWNKVEALKCLYVAVTRASKNVMIRL